MPRPTFRRQSRFYLDPPGEEIVIADPPARPTRSTGGLVAVLLPGIFAVAMLVVSLTVMRLGNAAWMLMSLGFTGISAVLAIGRYISQRRAYQRLMRVRRQKYESLLGQRRQDIQQLRDQQASVLHEFHPDPSTCLFRIQSLDRRLWDRSPRDTDFLSLRLGMGRLAPTFKVKFQANPDLIDPDPLVLAGRRLAVEMSADIPDLPVCLPLSTLDVAGIYGQDSMRQNLVRAIAVQIATHHSPDEVKIVAIFPAEERQQWDWLRWLPHTWSADHNQRYLACDRAAAHDVLSELYTRLARRRRAATSQASAEREDLPCFIFFFAEPQFVENQPLIHLLLAHEIPGTRAIFVTSRLEILPRGCQVMVDVTGHEARLTLTANSSRIVFDPDRVSLSLTDDIARQMAPIQLERLAAPDEIPGLVPLFDALGIDQIEKLNVAEQWRVNRPGQSFAVPIGRGAGNKPLLLDLSERGHGPHGLVAGTTGSGKSELLQSIITSFAACFHPHDVVFILIDYKGGGMSNAFADLPHLIGTLTNLHGNLAMRALVALKSEIQRRQTLLGQAGLNHIDAYQLAYHAGRATTPLPHLILIVDEYAELNKEQPDFIRELVSTSRVGRSLGIHLILATQKPSGVVSDQIWGNSRFKICLRVENPEDSREVLKRADAANLTTPGRAFFQVGNDEIFEMFQSAFGGVACQSVASDDGAATVYRVDLDGKRSPLNRASPVSDGSGEGHLTQLQAVVRHIHCVAEQAGIQRLPGPWLPPLPEMITLDEIMPAGSENRPTGSPAPLAPIIGLVDDPACQAQTPLALDLARQAHWLIFGAPGTGKTTVLQSLLLSLARQYSPEEVNLYVVDFGTRLLTSFSDLPQVGGVVVADEGERLQRLFSHLVRIMERRKLRLTQARVGTLAAYRSATGQPSPDIVVLVDNLTGLLSAYPDFEETLVALIREGGNLGIHLIMTANAPSSVRLRIAGNVLAALSLQLADAGDYVSAVGRISGALPVFTPGRGFVKGKPPLEIQIALPAPGESEAERSAALQAEMTRLALAWQGPRVRPIPMLPESVWLDDLLPAERTWPEAPTSLTAPIGMTVVDLEEFGVDLNSGPHFLIAGPGQSGKTTLLLTWLLALAESLSPDHLQICLGNFSGSLSAVRRLPHVRWLVDSEAALSGALNEMTGLLQARRESNESTNRTGAGVFGVPTNLVHWPVIVLAIDDYGALTSRLGPATKFALETLIRRERGLGLHALISIASSDLAGLWLLDGVAKAMLEARTGFLVGSNDPEDRQRFGLRPLVGQAAGVLPIGLGHFVRRGQTCLVKVALPGGDLLAVAARAEHLRNRASATVMALEQAACRE